MMFWVISLGLAGLAALMMVRALFRSGGGEDAARFDIQVYRDQLREVERDLARGVLNETEAEAVRTEVSRRLLEADRRAQEGQDQDRASGPVTWAAGGLVAAAVTLGAAALYWGLGAPGYPDLPLERRIALAEEIRLTRPRQAEAEAQVGAVPAPPEAADARYVDLVRQLRDAVAERPDDLQGHQLLARHEARLGRFPEAHAAQTRVITLRGEEATAQDYVDLAELMVLAADGYVSPEAEVALREALARDPSNSVARYHSGLLAVQTGRPDIAFNLWRRLLEEGPESAPWIPPIRAQIFDLAQLAGVNYTPPVFEAGPGPTAEDMEAAQDMDPEDRQAMIEGMVAGLAERLATEGGTPEDWARLIRAYGVLGRSEAAAEIWAEAQAVFPESTVNSVLLEAARAAGVAE